MTAPGLIMMIALACQDTVQETYAPRPSFLARGDAAAGRKAYLALKCNTCHTVAANLPVQYARGCRVPNLASLSPWSLPNR